MHGCLSGNRARHVRTRDDEGSRRPRTRAPRCAACPNAIAPRGRCGNRQCGPERTWKGTLGQQRCAAVALHRAEHAGSH
ncbi:hypothetical protein DF045_36815 [Burkholderia cepacia]|nr:hypothetical protein DF045_36815 [Burkholderia cepacia]